MVLADAITRVITKDEDVFVPCTDKANQESIRTMLFHARKKILGEKEEEKIGISKFTYGTANFVKVYQRKSTKFFVLNEMGVPVQIEDDEEAINSAGNARAVTKMRSDGISDEEIKTWLKAQEEE